MTTKIVQIPFQGFYCSSHESELDFAVELMFSDDRGDANSGLCSHVQFDCNWGNVFESYAAEYVRQFAQKFELDSLKFESLNSPKYYNFSTDRIFAYIDESEIQKMYDNVDKLKLRKYLMDNFTSYDGFFSHYSNDLEAWGPLEDWDHNQLGALLSVFAGEFDEVDLMDSPRGNGKFEQWISDNTKDIGRLYNINDYLRTRSQRYE